MERSACNTTGYLDLLQTLDQPYPTGDLYVIAANLASHTSGPIREWLTAHPRIRQAFIPVGADWLNLIEGWSRLVADLPAPSLRGPVVG